MEIMYHISRQSYGTEVNKALKKVYLYSGIFCQFFSIVAWIINYWVTKDSYDVYQLPLVKGLTIFSIIVCAIIIYYIFKGMYPKYHNKSIIKKNQRNIGNIKLELDEDYIHITSDKKTVTYKRNKVLGVKILDLTYCIIFSKHIYIVIPKDPNKLTDVEKQKYTEDLTAIIKEIERTSKRKKASR